MAKKKRKKKTSTKKQGTGKKEIRKASEEQRDTCILFAGVLDIRNFSELTARVDGFVRSYCTEKTRVKVFKEYRDYVASTQLRAVSNVRSGIRNAIKAVGRANPPLIYAIKPTGDGLLVVVKVEDLDEHITDTGKGGYNPTKIELNCKACYSRLKPILSALFQTVAESQLSKSGMSGDIAEMTRIFLKNHGKHLGYINQPENGMLELACGCALGVGVFVAPSDELFKGILADKRQYIDASGHAVNVAFRLCDVACRPSTGNGDRSPAMLLQRHLMHVLQDSGMTRRSPFWKYTTELKPFDIESPLKGVEDRSCWAIQWTSE